MADSVTGNCLCGAVQYSCDADLEHAHACHCHMCQRAGGVSLSVKCVSPVKITGEENLRVYKSSEWGERLFCGNCGSSLVWRMQDYSLEFISTGTINTNPAIKFASQLFVDHKPAFYNFVEDTEMLTSADVAALYEDAGAGK